MENNEDGIRELRNPTRVGTESVASIRSVPAERKLRPAHASNGSRDARPHSVDSGSHNKAH
jgi:hypothetical protein